MADQRLKGQEISIRVIRDGNVIDEINSISNFNDNVALELKEEGYIGEFVNRFDEIFNGYGGDMEFHVNSGNWENLVTAIIARAQRQTPDVTFNVVRTDFFPNSDTVIYTYANVNWGPIPTTVGSRGDYVKAKLEFRSSERPTKINSFL